MRLVSGGKIGDLLPINSIYRQKIGDFLTFFWEKNPGILALGLFYVFDPTVQISSAFLKESNDYILIQRLILNLKLDLMVQNDL